MIRIGDTWIDAESIESIQATPKPNWEHSGVLLVVIRTKSGGLYNGELQLHEVQKIVDLKEELT